MITLAEFTYAHEQQIIFAMWVFAIGVPVGLIAIAFAIGKRKN